MNQRALRFLAALVPGVLLAGLHGCGQVRLTPAPHQRKQPGPATQRPYRIGGRTYYPIPTAHGYRETGIASWYGRKFHGRRTANGEIYDMYADTAAHKTLPMNTVVLVRNLDNGRSTVVRINDRGPFVKNRIIDLSYGAARKLGLDRTGTARVVITALGEREKTAAGAGSPEKKTIRLKSQDFDRGRFYIRVATFEEHDKAMEVGQKFAARGRDVIIQRFPAAGTHLYRVLVYAGTSLRKARKEEKLLESQGYPYALVINRDSGPRQAAGRR